MAYDAGRGRMVIFGGSGTSGFLNDTWEWDGNAWTQVALIGPSPFPRSSSSLAFDPIRNRVVLFGGANPGVNPPYFDDTWEWDGSVWTQIMPIGLGPTARYAQRMSFDVRTSRVIMFGGFDGSFLGDTWEWDGSTWTKRSTIGPTPRGVSGMALDSGQNKVVLYGGLDAMGTYLSDTWEYHGVRLGDMNDDGNVNGLDIAPFVIAMLANSMNPVDLYLADFDGNAILDEGDLSGFVSTLLAEPS
ncbi:MAG: hypothetical protein HZA51_17970 [Planctomycetes bacterium]|nr:hypothetical protein [Planctomycetota bacterium]